MGSEYSVVSVDSARNEVCGQGLGRQHKPIQLIEKGAELSNGGADLDFIQLVKSIWEAFIAGDQLIGPKDRQVVR